MQEGISFLLLMYLLVSDALHAMVEEKEQKKKKKKHEEEVKERRKPRERGNGV